MASIFLTQGISILYNLYYGVVANAAIGIGNQVRSAVLKLTGNLTMSFGPQLVINYANGDWGKVNKIWTIGNKVALGLFAAVAIPIIIDADYILEIWLEKPPKYTAIFLRLILIENLIRFLAAYASTVIRATGRIKKYELISNIFNVLAFVLIIIGFKTVDSIKLPYFILIFTTIIQITYSTFLACNCINYNSKKYFVSNTGLSLIALIVAVTIGIITMPSSFTVLKLLFHCALVAISVIISLYYIGLLPHERDYINITAKNIILKKWIK